jgi:hypothetical protein
MSTYPNPTTSPIAEPSQRKVAWVAALSLVLMGVLGPFALIGVLQDMLMPSNASATVDNIVLSLGLFRSGVAALLIVVMLDVVVAWALYVLLRPVNRTVALVMGWLRLGYAAMFATALTNLLDVAQLLDSSVGLALPVEQLQAQVMTSLNSFHIGFEGIALAIFGLHLFTLGYLVFKSTNFPRFLGALVVIAGAGYLFDSFGTILVPNYTLTVGAYTFLGEVLLIFWLLYRAVKGFKAEEAPTGHGSQIRLAQPSPMTN